MNCRSVWGCLLGLCIGLSACEHKELCYNHAHGADVRILFDWQLLADSLHPEGMRVACYPATGGDGWLYDFTDLRGGVVNLPPNVYQVVCYNKTVVAFSLIKFNNFFCRTLTATANIFSVTMHFK